MPSISPAISSAESYTALVQRARDIALNITARHADEDDRMARWPAETMAALAEAGLTGLNAPADLGGHGLGLTALVGVTEAMARESASTGLCYAMHCVGTIVIAAKATPLQREKYLAPIAAGRHITTLALSEPGTGAFFFYPRLAVSRDDKVYRLDGTKAFVTNATHADSYVLSTAPVIGDAAEGAFNCFVVDRDSSGLAWLDAWQGFGMRSNDSRTLQLTDVRVPRENLLGAEGDQLWYIFEVIAPAFLMAMAATYLGVAQSALAEAREYVGTRRYAHSGELIGGAPVVSHRLGELWIATESARTLVYAAAQRGDAGDPDAVLAILAAKAAASDAATYVANEAMTLCGGSAYRENSRLARILRDARASHVMTPTTDLLKTWLGRAQLNLPLI